MTFHSSGAASLKVVADPAGKTKIICYWIRNALTHRKHCLIERLLGALVGNAWKTLGKESRERVGAFLAEDRNVNEDTSHCIRRKSSISSFEPNNETKGKKKKKKKKKKKASIRIKRKTENTKSYSKQNQHDERKPFQNLIFSKDSNHDDC